MEDELLSKKELVMVQNKIESETFYTAMYEHLFPSDLRNKKFQRLKRKYLEAHHKLKQFIDESEEQFK